MLNLLFTWLKSEMLNTKLQITTLSLFAWLHESISLNSTDHYLIYLMEIIFVLYIILLLKCSCRLQVGDWRLLNYSKDVKCKKYFD